MPVLKMLKLAAISWFIDTNRYSVPTEYVGKRLQARLYPFEIRLVYNDKVVAVHDRLFGKNKEILHPYHFLSLLWKKARGYDQAKVIQDWKLPEIYTEYHLSLIHISEPTRPY